MPRKLTDKQQQALGYIHDYTEQHGYPPSLRDFAAHASISVKGATDHFRALERKQMIQRQSLTARSYTLTAAGRAALGLQAAKDSRIPVYENPRQAAVDFISTPQPGLFGDESRLFGLRMVGDAMLGASIRPDDILVFRAVAAVEPGTIVAMEVQGQVLIRFYFAPWLKAANPLVGDTRADGRLLGKLQGVIRSY